MNIFTAIFGSEDAKAQARQDDAKRRADKEAAREARAAEALSRQKAQEAARKVQIDAVSQRKEARTAARTVRTQLRMDKRTAVSENNSASRDKLAGILSPAAAIEALGQLDLSQKTANVQARQAGKTARAEARQGALTQRNADRAAAGDTTTPAQDILAEVGAIFSSESQGAQDNFTKLAGAYLGSKGGLSSADSALVDGLTEGADASASVSTPAGSASASASSGVLPLLGLGLGLAALAFGGKGK